MRYTLSNTKVKKEGENNGKKWVLSEGTFSDGTTSVTASYFGQIPEGEVEGEMSDGQWGKKFSPAKKGGSRTAQMERVMNKKAESISRAQDKKEDAIKIASCNGQAGNIVSALIHSGQLKGRQNIEEALKYWRSYLYTRWYEVNSDNVTPFD